MNVVTIEPTPRAGEEATVAVIDDIGRPVSGVTVRVVHRPGLDGSRELAIGITDGLGRVRWTPEESGTAEIRAEEVALPIAIAWTAIPTGTATLLALLLIAAVIATGFGLTPTHRWTSR